MIVIVPSLLLIALTSLIALHLIPCALKLYLKLKILLGGAFTFLRTSKYGLTGGFFFGGGSLCSGRARVRLVSRATERAILVNIDTSLAELIQFCDEFSLVSSSKDELTIGVSSHIIIYHFLGFP